MTQILVVPHGGRWAVKTSPDATPVAEYETVQLAEAAARDMAAESGAEVVVESAGGDTAERPANVHPEGHESDLADPQDGIDRRTGDTRGTEEARLPQAGL